MSVRQKFEQIKRRMSGLIVEAERVREKLTDDAPNQKVRAIQAQHSQIVSEIEGLTAERDALAVAAIDGDGLATRDLHALQQDDGAAIVERHIGQSRGSNMPEDRNLVSHSAAALKLLRRADFFSERSLAEEMIEAGESDEAVMAAVTEAHRIKSFAKRPIGGPRGEITRSDHISFDNPHDRLRVASDVLAPKVGGKSELEASRELLGRSFNEVIGFLRGEREWRGWRPSNQDVEFRAGAHSASDFPIALGNAMNKVMKEQIAALETGASQIIYPVTAKDFRPVTEVSTSSFPGFQKINEGGEIHFGTIDETGETYQLGSYASGLSFTFQAMVNDDSSSLQRGIRDTSVAIVHLKSTLIVAALSAVMSDGHTLFHSSHSNLAGAGSPPAVPSLGAGQTALQMQNSFSGTPMGLRGKFLLVPPSLETAGLQLAASLTPHAVSDVNPFAGQITVAVEPRLTGTAWYLFADPSIYPTIKFATLAGFEAPRFEMEQAFDQLVTRYRCHWHIGAAPVDFRGAYKDPGA